MAWYESYPELKHEYSEEKDFYEDMLERNAAEDKRMRKSFLSSKWSRRKGRTKNPQRVVFDMLNVRDTVRNLLRIHGVPKNCKIGIAMLGQIGRGAAGFEDIGVWKKPFIMLDANIYQDCEEENMMDVYCGVGLHEASHIKHSRKTYIRMQKGLLEGERKMWEGLFEDERIEQKVRDESPGYAGYIQAAKRALFEKKEFGAALTKWDDPDVMQSDFDKINCIIFGFIRCGYLMTEDMKKWTTINGRCLFQELRKMFPSIPETEDEVEDYGKRLLDWYNQLKQEYKDLMGKDVSELSKELAEMLAKQGLQSPNRPPEKGKGPGTKMPPGMKLPGAPGSPGNLGDSEPGDDAPDASNEGSGVPMGHSSDPSEDSGDTGETAQGKASPGGGAAKGHAKDVEYTDEELESLEKELEDRINKQKLADAQDEEVSKAQKDLEDFLKGVENEFKKLADEETATSAAANTSETDKLKKLDEKRKKLEEKVSKELKERIEQGRFGLMDLLEMLRRINEVSKPLDASESTEMASAVNERLELSKDWEPEGCTVPHKTVIVHPVADDKHKSKYRNYYNAVKNEVARMRSVFRLRLGTRKHRQTEKIEGRLHRRQLAKATMTNRLFKREYTTEDKGIAIGLLLDESGSMSDANNMPSRTKASTCLQMAVCMAEALKTLPGIELEVYSFTTADRRGGDHHDTLFKYLYGKNNKKIESMADYGSGSGNFDYMAIMTAANKLKKNTENQNRLLIVLSDGAPCGHTSRADGSYMNAYESTKCAVDAVRKQGVKVMQVAIEDHLNSASMYGKKWVVEFTDLPQLIQDMRKLFTRLVRDTTESGM